MTLIVIHVRRSIWFDRKRSSRGVFTIGTFGTIFSHLTFCISFVFCTLLNKYNPPPGRFIYIHYFARIHTYLCVFMRWNWSLIRWKYWILNIHIFPREQYPRAWNAECIIITMWLDYKFRSLTNTDCQHKCNYIDSTTLSGNVAEFSHHCSRSVLLHDFHIIIFICLLSHSVCQIFTHKSA